MALEDGLASHARDTLTVRASGGAAVGVVTEGVDVESSLGVGIVASDVPGDGSRGRLGLLLEDDSTGDLGVTSENAHYKALC